MFSHSLSRRVRVTALSCTLLLSGYALLDTTTAGAAPRQPVPSEHVVSAAGAAPATSKVDPNLPADDPATGVVRKGLAVGKGNCQGLLEEVMPNGSSQCTHGPDAAPKGVDVRKARSVEDIALT